MVRREAVRARSYRKLVGVLVQKVNRSRLRTIGYRHVGSAARSTGPDDTSDGWMRREREIDKVDAIAPCHPRNCSSEIVC